MKASLGDRIQFDLKPVVRRGLVAPSATTLEVDPRDGKAPIDVPLQASTPPDCDTLAGTLQHHLTTMKPAELEALFGQVVETDRAATAATRASKRTWWIAKAADFVLAAAGAIAMWGAADGCLSILTHNRLAMMPLELQGLSPVTMPAIMLSMLSAFLGYRLATSNQGLLIEMMGGMAGVTPAMRLIGAADHRLIENDKAVADIARATATEAKQALTAVLESPNGYASIDPPKAVLARAPRFLKALTLNELVNEAT